MSSDASAVALAALMDAVSLLRGEVAALARSNARIEENQLEMQRRLDVLDTGMAPIADLLPFQEAILASTVEGSATTHKWLGLVAPVLDRIADQSDHSRDAISTLHQDVLRTHEAADTGQRRAAGIASGLEVIAEQLTSAVAESRKLQSADFATTGELISFTRAAVLGQPAALPVHLEDNTMLERFILDQPADLTSNDPRLGRLAKGPCCRQHRRSDYPSSEAADTIPDRHSADPAHSVSACCNHASKDRGARSGAACAVYDDAGNRSIGRDRL